MNRFLLYTRHATAARRAFLSLSVPVALAAAAVLSAPPNPVSGQDTVPAGTAAEGPPHTRPTPHALAAPLTAPIELDGRLRESDWLNGSAATDFRQAQPKEGDAAIQRTEVRFRYDDDALYVGARMYDTEGLRGVRTRLKPRDSEEDSDYLEIILDTFHDHLGRTDFTINPSGVKSDALGLGGSGLDDSWQPVWEAATATDSLGWTAELRIPFNQLRFPRDPLQRWGLQIWRHEMRTNEVSMWSFFPSTEVGGAPVFGHLDGLRIAARPRSAEIMPYAVMRAAYLEPGPAGDPYHTGRDWDTRFGADAKYLLTSNLTLDATVNPDFGQVEVDPAVVNLSAFETFFPEKRPFFIENAGLFSFGGLNCFFCSNVDGLSLFYSRRIGRSPQGASIARDSGEFADIPESATILGAAKITGRTGGGYSVGVLDAVTGRARADVLREDGTGFRPEVEPATNYFVSRLRRDFAGGNRQVGGMFTSVVRDFAEPALRDRLTRHAESGGVDWSLWWRDHTYRLFGSLAASNVTGDPAAILRLQRSSARYYQRPDRERHGGGWAGGNYDSTATSLRGYAGYVRLSKEQGNWLAESSVNFRSPGFEVNDIAYLARADYTWMNGNVLRQWTRPTKYFRNFVAIAGAQQAFNSEGDLTDREMQFFLQGELHNWWDFSAFVIRNAAVFDDRATRGGPVVRRPGGTYFSASLGTDSRRSVAVDFEPSYWHGDEGNYDLGLSLELMLKPASNIAFSLEPAFERSTSARMYVDRVDDPTATAFYGSRYVFSDLLQKTVSMETRVNVTFSPTLSLGIYAQPFISSANYSRFKEYVRPRTLDVAVYGRDAGTIERITVDDEPSYRIDPDAAGPAQAFTIEDPDFNFRSLRGNAVLRWEYRPGSTLYLVWTQERSDEAGVGNLDFGRDRAALFRARPNNVFLVKASYWLGW